MNKNKKIIAGIAAFAVVAFIIWWVTKPAKDDCKYSRSLEAADGWAAPFLNGGFQDVTHLPNYYKCDAPQRGDLVYYEMGNPPRPYYRILVAQSGDAVQLVPDLDMRGWNIIVNDEMYMEGEKPYRLGLFDRDPVLALYMPNRQKTLTDGDIIVLGSVSPGFNDSGVFGMFHITTLQGIVKLKGDHKSAYEAWKTQAFSKEAAEAYFENYAKNKTAFDKEQARYYRAREAQVRARKGLPPVATAPMAVTPMPMPMPMQVPKSNRK